MSTCAAQHNLDQGEGSPEGPCLCERIFVSLFCWKCTPAEIHLWLKDVWEEVWAKGEHDVGLIWGAKPVVITPKSDYKPRQTQYPLKPEVVEEVRPVFNSLLKAGVVVPCPDSPVRTPIFPVKKARKLPQPDEGWFVQDLHAVKFSHSWLLLAPICWRSYDSYTL